MGGKKRKIEIKFIEGKAVRSVTYTKRRNGLFRKASELCLLSPTAQIAILATPPSTHSHAGFYSFGHSSVDHVVSSLLHDQSPGDPTNQVGNRKLGCWWEDEDLERLENVDELRDATDAVTRMLNNVRIRLDDVRSNQRDGALVIHQEEAPKIRNINNERTNQITNSEGASPGLVIQQEEVPKIRNTNNERTQITNSEGASSGLVIHEGDVPQPCNTNTNYKNEETTTTQIANSEGASDSGSLVEKEDGILHIDGLDIDEFFTDFKFDPLFKF
ncbi:AGAMOUS-like 55 [Hirschfeldia incana]|nr:AGAMOUS-like 55 [Hirschfeldia incana]